MDLLIVLALFGGGWWALARPRTTQPSGKASPAAVEDAQAALAGTRGLVYAGDVPRSLSVPQPARDVTPGLWESELAVLYAERPWSVAPSPSVGGVLSNQLQNAFGLLGWLSGPSWWLADGLFAIGRSTGSPAPMTPALSPYVKGSVQS